MFYKFLAMLLVIAGLTWIGADQITLLIIGALLLLNNLLAWMIKFAFKPTAEKPTNYVEERSPSTFAD